MTVLRTNGVNNPNQTVLDLDAGSNVTLSGSAGGKVTISADVTVTSVFGRTGAIVATSGDYSFSLISGMLSESQLPAVIDDEIIFLRVRVQALELALADLGINVEEYEAEDIGEHVNGS
jgi:hypothetical protein